MATKSKTSRLTRPKTTATRTPGRPSKLAPKQWDEIRRRLAAGESTSALAREFKVGKATISERCSQKVQRIKKLATTMVETEQIFENMPVSEQAAVLNLIDQMKATTHNLANAARHGSATSARLARIAYGKAVQLDSDDVDMADLKQIAALTQTANQAATIGTDLLAATRNTPLAQPEPSEPSVFEKMTTEELETFLFKKYEALKPHVPIQPNCKRESTPSDD